MPTAWPGLRAGMKRVKMVFSGWAETMETIRQHAREPRHFPFGAFGKHPLHVDAEMNRGLSEYAVAQLIAFGHRNPSPWVFPTVFAGRWFLERVVRTDAAVPRYFACGAASDDPAIRKKEGLRPGKHRPCLR